MSKEKYLKIKPIMEQLMGLLDDYFYLKEEKGFYKEKKELEKQIDSIITEVANICSKTFLNESDLKLKD